MDVFGCVSIVRIVIRDHKGEHRQVDTQSPHFVEYQEVSAVDSPTKKAADLFDRHAVSTVSSGEIN